MQVCHAIQHAHQKGIIHRDIKPQNIMLTADGTDVELVDFGLAAEVRTSVMRVSQVQMETCGTYPYMAPEQFGMDTIDERTDLWDLLHDARYDVYLVQDAVFGRDPMGRDEFRRAGTYPFPGFNYVALPVGTPVTRLR